MKSARVFAALVLGFCLSVPLKAIAVTPPSLIISQFKITSADGQFFMLYNASDQTIDMSAVQLVYYNNFNLANATSSKIIPLSGSLPPQGYYLINDGPLTLCYRMIVDSVSLGLSTTAGSVQVSRLTQASPGAPVNVSTEDSASWSKTAALGAVQLPPSGQFLLRNPMDTNNNPVISSAGAGAWQPVTINSQNPCLLTSVNINAPPPVISASLLLLSSSPPPVTIVSLATEPSGPYLPSGDIGLMAPVVNELLANPGSPGTDANDEFIELYNPNDKPFDLTGFQLQVGLTTKKTWQFPDGTLLNGKSFSAFMSSQTGLSLSNSGGLASLLDPFGNAISASDEYSTAKDNQAWALAGSDWFWTSKPTPGAANIIDAGVQSTSKKTSSGSSSSASTKGVSTSGLPTTSGFVNTTNQPDVTTLHPSALASVAVLAVGYGAYEYKQDLANKYRKLRADRAARRKISGKP